MGKRERERDHPFSFQSFRDEAKAHRANGQPVRRPSINLRLLQAQPAHSADANVAQYFVAGWTVAGISGPHPHSSSRTVVANVTVAVGFSSSPSR
jgi:hypothetical protein